MKRVTSLLLIVALCMVFTLGASLRAVPAFATAPASEVIAPQAPSTYFVDFGKLFQLTVKKVVNTKTEKRYYYSKDELKLCHQIDLDDALEIYMELNGFESSDDIYGEDEFIVMKVQR